MWPRMATVTVQLTDDRTNHDDTVTGMRTAMLVCGDAVGTDQD